jgi:hypothetical protein
MADAGSNPRTRTRGELRKAIPGGGEIGLKTQVRIPAIDMSASSAQLLQRLVRHTRRRDDPKVVAAVRGPSRRAR